MLEANQYSDNAFVTLSYDEEHLPRLPDGRGILVRQDLTNWLKRIRKALEPFDRKIRFFGVGEYGDETWRPHYHIALFNYPTCRFGRSRYELGYKNCCYACDMVRDTWGRGNVLLGTLSTESAQYVCGYVTKKMTAKTDPRLDGRTPEFPAMSLRPGIGGDAMWEVADTVMKFNLETPEGDVPSSLRHGSRTLPLGRYLTKRLRKMVGKDEKAPQGVLDKVKSELQPVRQAAFDASENLSEAIAKKSAQAVRNMEARQKIFSQRKKL